MCAADVSEYWLADTYKHPCGRAFASSSPQPLHCLLVPDQQKLLRPVQMAARALCLLLALAAAGSGALACTTVMVGAGATTDGSIIMARNNDEENATVIHNLYYHPARTAAAPFRCFNCSRECLPALKGWWGLGVA